MGSVAALLACGDASREEGESTSGTHTPSFEVWLLDQSNSNGTFGGRVYIYRGADLRQTDPSGTQPETVIDLGAAAATMCMTNTGANPVRPHMLFFNSTRTHAIISFVASGHVLIMNAASRSPVACLRMLPGAGGAIQAHAAYPDPLNRFIIVANQNGKALHRIDTNYSTNTFTLNAAATIDLANCTTPTGVACQAAGIRPDNAPICPIIDNDGDYTFVTLRGGGLFVVRAHVTPMQIVGEYDMTTVHGNGCGGVEADDDRMWINSGGGTATNLTEFDVYRFPTWGYSTSNPANTPARSVVFSDDSATFDRDAHGMVLSSGGDEVWVYDRAANQASVFEVSNRQLINTVSLAHPASSDPTPDLSDRYDSRQYISLRGPNPLTGDPHVATGAVPGLAILQMDSYQEDGSVIAILPISNIDATGVQRADAHGVRVRRL